MAGEWLPLQGVTHDELTLEHTLPTGQTFRWRKTGAHTYTGVIGRRVVQLRQRPPASPSSSPSSAAATAAADDDNDQAGRCLWRLASRPPAGVSQADEMAAAEAALRDYLNLGPDRPRLADLARGWAAADARYRAVAAALPGARMLRQPPLECLFSFVCSSNNHISRIHGMVERLCARYGGEAIELEPWAERELAALASKGRVVPATPATLESGLDDDDEEEEEGQEEQGAWAAAAAAAAGGADDVIVKVELVGTPAAKAAGRKRRAAAASPEPRAAPAPSSPREEEGAAAAPAFWAFPTLEQLEAATEDALRADGFGYRARYITGSVALMRAKAAAAASSPGEAGAHQGGAGAAGGWLLSLRSAEVPLERAVEALTELPGVGPKVASCVALFALDKHGAVPVDTHVWDLAKKYYAREQLRGKAAPAAALHPIVQRAFTDAFGPYAGWAHNALFVGELPAFQSRVRAAAAAARRRAEQKGGDGAAESGEGNGGTSSEEEEDDDGGDSDFELRTPAGGAAGKGSQNKTKKKQKAASPAAVARDERRRRRAESKGQQAPLPFESVLA